MRTVAVRTVSRIRPSDPERHLPFDDLVADAVIDDDPGLDVLRRRHGEALKAAVKAAVAALPADERRVLRYSLLGGKSDSEIARLLKIHRHTVKSRSESARVTIRKETCRLVRPQLAISDAEFDSLLLALHSGLDVTFGSLLAASDAPDEEGGEED